MENPLERPEPGVEGSQDVICCLFRTASDLTTLATRSVPDWSIKVERIYEEDKEVH